jgi:hypothetical protein
MAAVINYTPPVTIRQFITASLPAELFYAFIIGPVGSGKTTGNFFKLIYHAQQQTPSPVDKVRRSRAVIVRNTFPQLRDTTIPSFSYWFKDGEAGKWKATEKNFLLRLNDVECEVMFRALDTADDIARVLSLETTFVILDEFVQIPKEIVEALAARCGRYPPSKDGGATNWGMWGASNPGNEDDWWHDWLEDNDVRPTNCFFFKQPSGLSSEAENVDNLPGNTRYYTSLVTGKADAWVKQFVEAQWGYSIVGKPVVPTFNAKLHVAEKPLLYSPYLPLVAGLDPGLGGSAFVFGQMDKFGRLLVLDELCQRDYGASRLLKDRLKPLLASRFPGADFVISPDPAAFARSQTDEKAVVDIIRDAKYKVKVPDMNNQLPTRLEPIEHFTTRLTESGPALLIDPRCKTLIRALRSGWRYTITLQGAQRGVVSPEPMKNEYSHPGDGFAYLCKYFYHAEYKEARRTTQRAMPVVTNPYVMR